MSDLARISPTAHYTSYVWYRNGLSHPALATSRGRVLYGVLAPLNAAYTRLTGKPDLERNLLARHRTIDGLLERALAAGEVAQVIEVAAGLSPRGMRFRARHPELLYVEGDLPGMAQLKREILSGEGLLGPSHQVVEVDAMLEDGSQSLRQTGDALLPAGGTAVITEGLLNYLDEAAVRGIWARVAAFLRARGGVYLADLSVSDETRGPAALVFKRMLEIFVRGQLHVHFATVDAAAEALGEAGFGRVALHSLGEDAPYMARIIEARP